MKFLLLVVFIICIVGAIENNRKEQEDIKMGGGHMAFEGSEHRAAADSGYITLLEIKAANSSFILAPVNASTLWYNFTNAKGTLLYSYGDIVAFSGDFFGPENELSIVCSASSDEEAQSLFFASFSKLWNTQDSKYINKIREEFQRELDGVAANSARYPYAAFAKLPESRWTSVFKSKLEMGLLLTSNLDHFSSCAVYTYSVGHQLALETALEAKDMALQCRNSSVTDPLACLATVMQKIYLAYAINAFSDHFMTDLFAAGHIRTPRRFLTTTCMGGQAYVSSFLGALSSGGLASQWMHDEDNRNGLLVSNKRGDVWTAFGDDNYFDSRNAKNRAIVQEAAQISRNEVMETFLGLRTTEDIFGALMLIPDAAKLSQFAANNTCPLFYTDSKSYGIVYIRDKEQIRPDVWRVPRGFPGNSSQITCNYTIFTYNDCPHAILSKTEAFLPTWFSNAFSQKLEYSIEDAAWSTLRPDASSSALPATIFGVSGLVIGLVLTIAFAITEFVAHWHKSRFEDVIPKKNDRNCFWLFVDTFLCCSKGQCEEKAGHQVIWVVISAILPSMLLCLLAIPLFVLVLNLMPDWERVLTRTVWGTYFGVGIASVVAARCIVYNLTRFLISLCCPSPPEKGESVEEEPVNEEL